MQVVYSIPLNFVSSLTVTLLFSTHTLYPCSKSLACFLSLTRTNKTTQWILRTVKIISLDLVCCAFLLSLAFSVTISCSSNICINNIPYIVMQTMCLSTQFSLSCVTITFIYARSFKSICNLYLFFSFHWYNYFIHILYDNDTFVYTIVLMYTEL